LKIKIHERALKLYCTFFFLGYSPVAPGSVGTLGAVLVFYIISDLKSLLYFITIITVTIISIYITNKALKYYDSDDPGEIVIDEVCGYLFTMFLVPFSWTNVGVGFILFRLFDIAKPYPIRKIEKLKDGYGVILDDVLAGIYANIILLLFIKYL
jgi:phosphatidylglycerophosphatase A